ncbi:MAG: hypothetical protein ACE5OS_08615 [Anaerolineae bacterium]
MSGSRLLRSFCIALVGGFLAGVLIAALLRWRRRTAAPRPRQAIVLAEVPL